MVEVFASYRAYGLVYALGNAVFFGGVGCSGIVKDTVNVTEGLNVPAEVFPGIVGGNYSVRSAGYCADACRNFGEKCGGL